MQKDAKKKPEDKPEDKTPEPEKKQDDSAEPGADTPPDDKSKADDQPADDGKKDEPEKKDDKPEDEPSDKGQGDDNGEGADAPPVYTPPETPATSDKPAEDSMNFELLNTKAQLAAIKSGVRVDVVEDAVCLAMHDAKKNGELTEESVAEALSGVLSRHPEWKETPETKNNFRVGGDGSKENHSSNEEISRIFGNK